MQTEKQAAVIVALSDIFQTNELPQFTTIQVDIGEWHQTVPLTTVLKIFKLKNVVRGFSGQKHTYFVCSHPDVPELKFSIKILNSELEEFEEVKKEKSFRIPSNIEENIEVPHTQC